MTSAPPAAIDAVRPTTVGSTWDGPAAARLRLARIALGLFVEPGNRDLGRLVAHIGPVAALRALTSPGADTADAAPVRGSEARSTSTSDRFPASVPDRLRTAVAARWKGADPYEVADAALGRADRLGSRVLTPEQPEWPARLCDLDRLSRDVADPIQRDTYPPMCLWVRGEGSLGALCDRSVSVVGARASTTYGDHVAAELGYGLAAQGWTVVSGGAFGIDAAAHRGALAGGGATVAILACGVDRPYPTSHVNLFDRIVEHGLLVSEWPPGSDPHRHRFLVRNRVIAALTRGTVVVEANVRSGARFTLRRARDLGRMVMAVPGPVTSAMSVGCHEELREPGTVLVASVAHVLDAVGTIGADLAPPMRADDVPRDRLTALERQVLDGVRPRKVLSAEEIAAAVGVSTRDSRRALPALELAGFVTAVPGGYRLARKTESCPPSPRPGRPKRSGVP